MSNGEITTTMIKKVGKYLRATNQIQEKEKIFSDEEIGKIRYKKVSGFFKLYNDAEKYFNSKNFSRKRNYLPVCLPLSDSSLLTRYLLYSQSLMVFISLPKDITSV